MKTVKLGDVFLWKGQLVEAKWMNQGHPAIGFVTMETVRCPHCGENHEVAASHEVIISSPLFQQNAEPVQTITNNHGIKTIIP